MKRLLSALFLLLLAAAPVAAGVATGEWEYSFKWNGIPAARATVDVHQQSDGSYIVGADTRTNAVVDLLWRLRGHVESRFDPTFAPLGFRYSRDINRKPETTQIEFRSSEPFATGLHERSDRKVVVSVVEDEVLDPVTAIFHALQRPLEPGDRVQYDVFTGDSRYLVELHALDREVIEVGAGTFPTLRIEPKVWKVGQGLEARLRGATIWVAEGEARVPIRIRSDVFIGSVNVSLERVKGGA